MDSGPKAGEKYISVRWIAGIGSLSLALFISVFGWHAIQERESFWQLQMGKQADLQGQALLNILRRQQDQLQFLAENTVVDAWANELLRHAFVIQNSPDPDQAALASIRDQLLARLVPRWRNLQSGHSFKGYVHLARTSQSESFGDLPPALRKMLADTLQDKQSKVGLGFDDEGLVMRATAVLQVDGPDTPANIGVLEITLKIFDDIKRLDQEFGAGVALLRNRNGSPTHNGELLHDGTGQWYIDAHSRSQIRNWQAQLLLLPPPATANTFKLLKDQDHTYLLNQVLLPGYSPTSTPNRGTTAIALTWHDVSEQLARHQRDQQWLIGKGLLAWFAAEALFVLLLLSTSHTSRRLIRQLRGELQRKYRQSEQSGQLLAVIVQAQAAYITAKNHYEAFDRLLNGVLELTSSQFGFIGEVIENEEGIPSIRHLSGKSANTKHYPERAIREMVCHNLKPLFDQVMRSGRVLISNDPAHHQRIVGLSIGFPPLQAFAGLPIYAQGKLVGMLGLTNRPEGYQDALVEHLQPLLATLGQLIVALRRDAQREQTQQHLQRRQSALRTLNEVVSTPSPSSQEQLRHALQLGASFYQVPQAIISQIDAEDYLIKVQISPSGCLSDGLRFPLNETYASITLQTDDVLAIERMGRSAYAAHPCYLLQAQETYIGIVIWVAGQRFGTLCFFAPEARTQAFDEVDYEFLHLFARWVGSALEQQQREQTHQALLERLGEAQKIAQLGHWQIDLKTDELCCSDTIFDIFGFSPQNYAPSIKTFKRYVHPDCLALVEASEKRIRAGEAHDLVHRIVRPDGEMRWIHHRAFPQQDEQGQMIRLTGTVQDISEIKKYEAEAHETRAFLQAVLDAAIGVAIIATTPEGAISLFNSGAERLLGYTSEEMVGCTSLVIYLASEVQARSEVLSQKLGMPISGFETFVHRARSGAPDTGQWTCVHKNGQQRMVNLTVSAIVADDGAISGFLCIASDISEHQQAIRALQKSESRFRGMVANLPGVVYRGENDDAWSMHYMSEDILSLTGYPAREFIDNRVRSYASVIHPNDRGAIFSSIQNQLAYQHTFEATYRLQHADGHSVWVRERGRGEYDSQGKLLWLDGFIWDISEHKRIEDELRFSQRLFSSAFNTAPQGMALISPEGRWLEVNDELCRMLGYSRNELLCSDFQRITHPDDLAADLENIEALLAGQIGSYQLEKRYLDKVGRVIWVLLSVSLVRDGEGRPVHFVSQLQDFSERVATERTIREREHYLHTLLDNVLEAIITIDDMDRIRTVNPAAEKMFGHPQVDVAGRSIGILVPEPYRSALADYRPAMAELVGSTREMTGMHCSGEVFPIELAVSQISHQGQQCFIAVVRNISERKRMERMKNEFISTVSHELRTPLTAIAGSLGLVNGGVLGTVPTGMQQMLNIAEDNSQRLSQLINDLLDMDKLLSGKMKFALIEQPLRPLLEQAIVLNQPYASQYRVQLHLLESTPHVLVWVDSQRLAQVLTNLLSNAAKFSPSEHPVEVAVQVCGERVRVSVRDQGPGIPETFKANIFDKFAQADATNTRQKGGTGLGLAISQELIKQMDGQIGFESIEGQGTTFWFELPLHASPK